MISQAVKALRLKLGIGTCLRRRRLADLLILSMLALPCGPVWSQEAPRAEPPPLFLPDQCTAFPAGILSIYFKPDSPEITADEMKARIRYAIEVWRTDGGPVLLTGFTGPMLTSSVTLTADRLRVVRGALEAAGVPRTALWQRDGGDAPSAGGTDEEAILQAHRVDVVMPRAGSACRASVRVQYLGWFQRNCGQMPLATAPANCQSAIEALLDR